MLPVASEYVCKTSALNVLLKLSYKMEENGVRKRSFKSLFPVVLNTHLVNSHEVSGNTARLQGFLMHWWIEFPTQLSTQLWLVHHKGWWPNPAATEQPYFSRNHRHVLKLHSLAAQFWGFCWTEMGEGRLSLCSLITIFAFPMAYLIFTWCRMRPLWGGKDFYRFRPAWENINHSNFRQFAFHIHLLSGSVWCLLFCIQ